MLVGVCRCVHQNKQTLEGFNPNERKEYPLFYVYPRGPKKRDGQPAGKLLFKNSELATYQALPLAVSRAVCLCCFCCVGVQCHLPGVALWRLLLGCTRCLLHWLNAAHHLEVYLNVGDGDRELEERERGAREGRGEREREREKREERKERRRVHARHGTES